MNGLIKNGLYSTQGGYTAAAAGLVRGSFVTPNYTAKTAAVPGADALRDVYFVDNDITNPPELGIADRDFVIPVGTGLKLRKLQLGAKFITTSLEAAIGTYAVGGVVMISAAGKLKANAAGLFQATITDIFTTNYDTESALECIVTAV
jgi:hypothetical protein